MGPERYARLKAVLDRRQPDLTVLMEQVNKAHNFSAILRTGDAAGIMQIHAVPAERGLPIAHHTSAGSKKWVHVVEHDDVESAIATLRGRGMQIVAANLSPAARDYRTLDYTRPTAILVGAELEGVSARAIGLADCEVVIPMAGMVHSLNVSVATALLLFEAVRQREAAGMFDRSALDPEERERILFEWAHPRVAERLRARGVRYPVLSDDGAIEEGFTRAFRADRREPAGTDRPADPGGSRRP